MRVLSALVPTFPMLFCTASETTYPLQCVRTECGAPKMKKKGTRSDDHKGTVPRIESCKGDLLYEQPGEAC